MNIAFFGTPDFATTSLQALVESNYNIVAVITAQDKKSGRGMQVNISDVKKYALSKSLNILQPANMKNEEFVQKYIDLDIDLAIVVAFRMIPEVIWKIPKKGTINLHGSLLPNYRGAAPINWALINGEKNTGVTTFFINNNIDHGDILFQDKINISENDNFGTLYNKLASLGANLIIETVIKIESNNYTPIKQIFSDTDKSAPKITSEMMIIDDFENVNIISNKLKGLLPFYKPYIIYKSKKYFIRNFEISKIVNTNILGLATDNKTYIHLNCNNGTINILEIQLEGKKSLDIKSFFNGNKID